MKRFLCLAAILAIVALSAPAFAVNVIVTTNAVSGASWTSSGFSASTGSSTAPGIATGSLYSSSSTYFGPSRIAVVSFAPTAAQAGYYKINLAWPNTAGEKQTAVTLFTGANNGGTGSVDAWGNTGAPADVVYAGTMDMYYRASNVWNTFTTQKLNAGTTYKLGVYAGYKAPGNDGVASNRVALAGVQWLSCTPIAATLGGPANGAIGVDAAGINLDWTAGEFNSFFDVYFGTAEDPATKIGENLVEGTSSISTGALQAGTTYFWKVVSKNADLSASSAVYSFTTAAVPEPGSMLALGTGLIGLLGIIRRKRS